MLWLDVPFDCRQRRLVSRPGSRNGSRPGSRNGSRPGSRACSKMSMRAGLNGVKEEGEEDEEEGDWEWEYYYEDEEAELACISPTSTCAPTTRATSPFPQNPMQERQVRKKLSVTVNIRPK